MTSFSFVEILTCISRFLSKCQWMDKLPDVTNNNKSPGFPGNTGRGIIWTLSLLCWLLSNSQNHFDHTKMKGFYTHIYYHNTKFSFRKRCARICTQRLTYWARLDVMNFVSLWNWTGISAALLPRCLPNFRAIDSPTPNIADSKLHEILR